MQGFDGLIYIMWFVAGLVVGLIVRGGKVVIRRSEKRKYEFFCEKHGWVELDNLQVDKLNREVALLCPKCKQGLP